MKIPMCDVHGMHVLNCIRDLPQAFPSAAHIEARFGLESNEFSLRDLVHSEVMSNMVGALH